MVRATQYLFPNGEKRLRDLEGSDAAEHMAAELRAAGWSLEYEIHPDTQRINLDVCDAEEQLGLEMLENGPGVPAALERLILNAWSEWVKRGKPNGKGTTYLLSEAWDYAQRL